MSNVPQPCHMFQLSLNDAKLTVVAFRQCRAHDAWCWKCTSNSDWSSKLARAKQVATNWPPNAGYLLTLFCRSGRFVAGLVTWRRFHWVTLMTVHWRFKCWLIGAATSSLPLLFSAPVQSPQLQHLSDAVTEAARSRRRRRVSQASTHSDIGGGHSPFFHPLSHPPHFPFSLPSLFNPAGGALPWCILR